MNTTQASMWQIFLSSIESLKTAFADNTHGRNITQKTSEIAVAHGVILAINGDFYGAQSNSSQEDLVIYSDGSFSVVAEGSATASDLLEGGVLQVFSFGPGLLDNGEITVTHGEEVDKAMTSNPRTAIGIIDDLHYVMVVADGRTSASTGLTLYQLASFLKELGVAAAYNLDCGGSSTMYFNGTVVNSPTANGKKITERSVSDIDLWKLFQRVLEIFGTTSGYVQFYRIAGVVLAASGIIIYLFTHDSVALY